nr:MAG TPA: hypothetical protein [Caudoviricetes sp.]
MLIFNNLTYSYSRKSSEYWPFGTCNRLFSGKYGETYGIRHLFSSAYSE